MHKCVAQRSQSNKKVHEKNKYCRGDRARQGSSPLKTERKASPNHHAPTLPNYFLSTDSVVNPRTSADRQLPYGIVRTNIKDVTTR
jgi:hypothetical protein